MWHREGSTPAAMDTVHKPMGPDTQWQPVKIPHTIQPLVKLAPLIYVLEHVEFNCLFWSGR